MDLVEISLQTTLGFDVKFDIEAIEHYNGVHTASDFPSDSIIASDGRNPNVWLFLAYENDTYGHVGGSGGNICGGGWHGIYEAYDYSGGNSDAALVDVRWCH